MIVDMNSDFAHFLHRHSYDVPGGYAITRDQNFKLWELRTIKGPKEDSFIGFIKVEEPCGQAQ
jgi:hypothetical protein